MVDFEQKEQLILCQSPVYIYLENSDKRLKPIKKFLKSQNLLKLLRVEHNGETELIWPGFLVLERSSEISENLSKIQTQLKPGQKITKPYIKDKFMFYPKISKGEGESSQGAALVHLFGTNVYLKLKSNDLIPFEEVFVKVAEKMSNTTSKIKRMMALYFSLANGYFRALKQNMVQISLHREFANELYRLVIVEKKSKTQKPEKKFGILLA